MSIVINIALLILVIGVLTFVHELGHFLAAKLVGAKVSDFSIGFGPRLLSKKFKETTYNIRILPFGGYVKILGDGDPTTEKESRVDDGNLKNKSKLAQIFVMLAGVTMNIILAIILYTIFLSSSDWKLNIGKEYADFNPLGAEITSERISDLPYELTEDSEAVNSGMYKQGYIKSIAGNNIDSYSDLKETLSNIPNTNTTIEACELDTNVCKTFLVPVNEEGKVGMYIGDNYSVYLDYSDIKIFSGFAHSFNVVKLTGHVLGNMFTQAKESGDYSALSNSVSGPVGIYFVIDYFKNLGIFVFLGIVADLSISLAVMNLLPLPALDGGRVLILSLESLLRKDLDPKIEAIIINISFGFLILLIVLIMLKDIINIQELQSLFR